METMESIKKSLNEKQEELLGAEEQLASLQSKQEGLLRLKQEAEGALSAEDETQTRLVVSFAGGECTEADIEDSEAKADRLKGRLKIFAKSLEVVEKDIEIAKEKVASCLGVVKRVEEVVCLAVRDAELAQAVPFLRRALAAHNMGGFTYGGRGTSVNYFLEEIVHPALYKGTLDGDATWQELAADLKAQHLV
jgi:chromosome segregation ATPase